MSVRHRCPICSYPYPMHSDMCVQLQDQLEKIPSEQPIGKIQPAPLPIKRVVIYDGEDD